MARSIKDSLSLLKTSLGEIRAELETKIPSGGGGVLPQSLKVSEVASYIQQINTGNKLQIQVNGAGFPKGTVFTARHTDGTQVSGESPLTVAKAGTWTVTDSFSGFSDSVAVSDTFPVSHALPKITVTTDIGDGNIQTATCGGTKLEAAVSNGQAVFYVPKTGAWTIGCLQSSETVSVSVLSRIDYFVAYSKVAKTRFTVKITNGTGDHLYLFYSDYVYYKEYQMSWREIEDLGNVKGTFSKEVSVPKDADVQYLILGDEEWEIGGGDTDPQTCRYIVSMKKTPSEGETVSFDWSTNKKNCSTE